MANLGWTPEQADELLKNDVISPEVYEMWQQQNSAVNASSEPNMSTMDGGMSKAEDTPPEPNMSMAPKPVDLGDVDAPGFLPSQSSSIPPNVSVAGGITLAPRASPAPQSASPAPAPMKIQDASRDDVAEGNGLPTLGRPPTEDERRAAAGLPPLTPREQQDPEYRRRVAQSDAERGEVTKAARDEQKSQQDKTDIAVKEAQELYNAKVMAEAIVNGTKMRDQQERNKDLAAQQKYLEDLNARAAKIAEAKEKTNEQFRNRSTGEKILAGIMGFFGAVVPGAALVFREFTDKKIQEDLDAQQKELDERKGLYANYEKLYGDRDAARLHAQSDLKVMVANRMETIGASYAGGKKQAEGDQEAAKLRKEAAQDRAKANQIVWNNLQQQRAAAAAAAAAREAEERGFRRKLLEKDIDHQNAMELEGVKAGKSKKDKEGEHNRENEEFNENFDRLKKHPVLDSLGPQQITDSVLPHSINQRLFPKNARVVQDLNEINTQISQQIGKVAKDADGKPNKEMLERLEHRFSINPTDTKDMALQKLEGARNVVNALSRQQGATNAPKPNEPGSVEGYGKDKKSDDKKDPYAKYKVK